MVDEAPPAEASLPELAELLEGRVLVAHSAAFDRRVLAQAFERARLAVARSAGALHRRARAAPAPARRASASSAPLAGVARASRSRRRAPRARRRRDLRARLLRAVPAAVRQRADGRATRSRCSRRAPRAAARRRDRGGGACRRGTRRRLPDLSGLRDAPGVYVVPQRGRPGRSTSASRCACARACARTSRRRRRRPAWTARAETVEHQPHRVRARRAGARAAARRRAAAAGQREAQARRRLVSGCAAGSTSPSRCSRSRASRRAGHAVNVGPLRGRRDGRRAASSS